MKAILKDRSFRISILLTLIFFGIGIVFLFTGLADFSWALFILLPIVLGIALGAMPNKKYMLWGALGATAIVLIVLLIPGLSGLLCIVMTIPLILPVIFIGCIIGHLSERWQKIKSDKFHLLLIPLLPFLIIAPLEKNINKDKMAVVSVSTEQVFPYTPEQVYDAIKSVDTLDAEKPYLMLLDLPIPTKCILEKEEVGSIRTCHFKGGKLSNRDFGAGTITEKITQLERGKILKMDVVDCNVIGRKWLGFKEAIYYFQKAGDSNCKLIRVTTYTSVLSPRFYWEPLEKLGIQQEHDYVFSNLAKDLEKRYGKR